MLTNWIDHAYIINLRSREDRLLAALAECKRAKIPVEVFEAIDGYKENIPFKDYPGSDPNHWNAGAAALVLTTANIIRDAKAKGYKRILIMEDDVAFANIPGTDIPIINRMADSTMGLLPPDWHMLQFGSQHVWSPKPYKGLLCKTIYSFCLHCYVVNETIYDYYLELCVRCEKQLDFITAEDIQQLGHCYATPNVAYQRPSYSSIQQKEVDHHFLRQ